MALSNRVDLVIDPYTPTPVPPSQLPEVSLALSYVRSELSRIERAINELAESIPQAADSPPSNPRRGLQRLAISPWDPGSGSDKWYYWDGSAWALL